MPSPSSFFLLWMVKWMKDLTDKNDIDTAKGFSSYSSSDRCVGATAALSIPRLKLWLFVATFTNKLIYTTKEEHTVSSSTSQHIPTVSIQYLPYELGLYHARHMRTQIFWNREAWEDPPSDESALFHLIRDDSRKLLQAAKHGHQFQALWVYTVRAPDTQRQRLTDYHLV